MGRLWLALALAGGAGAASTGELLVNVYANMALTGPPAASWKAEVLQDASRLNLTTLDVAILVENPMSAEILGTLSFAEGEHRFRCSFAGADIAFLFVDDHLVCQAGAYSSPTNVTGTDNPLRRLAKASVPFRLELYAAGAPSAQGACVRVEVEVDAGTPTVSPVLAPPEMVRREMQKRLASGWGPWMHYTLLRQVHLPTGATLAISLCHLDSGVASGCQDIAWPDNDLTRVGALAYDFSYGTFNYTLNTTAEPTRISVRFSGGKDLHMLFSAEGPADRGHGTARLAVVIRAEGSWGRVVNATRGDAAVTFSPPGFPAFTVRGVGTQVSRGAAVHASAIAGGGAPSAYLVLPLSAGGDPVGLSTTQAATIPEIQAPLDRMQAKEEAKYEKYGELAKAKMAVQAALMWNWVYNPVEAGPFAPVCRSWDYAQGNSDRAWGYVMFDWDTIFASYMLSLDAKELAYSNLIQVIRAKTADGFVPNFSVGPHKTTLHSQPPVGSKVLLEIFRRHGDVWIVELLFDDLLGWNDWFISKRTGCGGSGEAANLICLGGEDMQNAKYESGLDNSPMYDGDFFDAARGQMQLYDVGMTSMVALDAESLAALADILGRPEGDRLRKRAKDLRALLTKEFWDEELGIFVNKLSRNESFYRRISPTSFYPLLTDGPSTAQVETSITGWLLNRTRFCITASGDSAGNSDDCYWGLPSISADDPAFPALGYWRGYVWGPMALLTYWGLRRHDAVPLAKTARRALASQMTSLVLRQWELHGHICENFSPHRNATECTGDLFYHWGALGAFISLLEQEADVREVVI